MLKSEDLFDENAVIIKLKGVLDTDVILVEVGGKSIEVARPDSGMVNT